MLTIEYRENINTLYKKSITDGIKSKNDMYEAIKDNNDLKEIENVFGAKIDKDNISKLWTGEIFMGMFDKMKDAKNMYSNIKKAQNEINKIKVDTLKTML